MENLDKNSIRNVVSCWTDLLGFGDNLNKVNWQLNEKNIEIFYDRLSRFSQQFIKHNKQIEDMTMINDGMLRTFKYQYHNGNDTFIHWLECCLYTQCVCTGQERDLNLPGLRTVLCEGQEFCYIYEGLFYKSLQYQLNTAFSKCYIIDSGGSELGLKKGGFYIEKSIVDLLIKKQKCKKYGDYLILNSNLKHGICGSHISLYEKVTDLIYLKNGEDLKLNENVRRDRTSWLKFSKSIKVKKGNLNFELMEIALYSPSDESAFLYFDTHKGNMRGIIDGSGPVSDHLGDVKIRDINNEDLKFFNETTLCIYRNKN